jgi:putative CocE/NonD family hydrolase
LADLKNKGTDVKSILPFYTPSIRAMLCKCWLILMLLLFCGQPNAAQKNNWSQYVTMPDGVRLAVDVWLPDNLGEQQNVPTILYSTRYWRSKEFSPANTQPNSAIKQFLKAGYAFVNVDVRGTGASFGVRKAEFSVAETKDFYHLIDWIIAQTWSNQRVATTGVSYAANTAEHSIFSNHPALKVANPRFSDFDWYTSLVFPGGIPNKIISSGWGSYVWALDMNEAAALQPTGSGSPKLLGVKPVDGDDGYALLAQAVKQHAANENVSKTLSHVVYRDDIIEASSLAEDDGHTVTPYRFKTLVEQSNTVLFHWGSWQDSGTAAGVLARFVSYDSVGEFIIGPWNHGGYQDANPFAAVDQPVSPSRVEQYQQIIDFFAPYMLHDQEAASLSIKRLKYFTMGENVWKTTSVWPPVGSQDKTWFLSAQNTLIDNVEQIIEGLDTYKVDFSVGTGNQTRWSTQVGRSDVYYGDRTVADSKLLTYTSAPLSEAVEITGSAIVSLQLSSTHSDGVIIAYLESVAPDGQVTMLTEGGLRLIHRKISTLLPPYPTFGPYRTFLREDAQSMTPNKMEQITFTMLPTSVLIPKGHSIRLALAGHDKDSFLRVPESGQPTFTIGRNNQGISFIRLPQVYSSNTAELKR